MSHKLVAYHKGTSSVKQGYTLSPILSNMYQNDLQYICGSIKPYSTPQKLETYHIIGTKFKGTSSVK